jgi:hypothetical protein
LKLKVVADIAADTGGLTSKFIMAAQLSVLLCWQKMMGGRIAEVS